jgi:hypothetical protein
MDQRQNANARDLDRLEADEGVAFPEFGEEAPGAAFVVGVFGELLLEQLLLHLGALGHGRAEHQEHREQARPTEVGQRRSHSHPDQRGIERVPYHPVNAGGDQALVAVDGGLVGPVRPEAEPTEDVDDRTDDHERQADAFHRQESGGIADVPDADFPANESIEAEEEQQHAERGDRPGLLAVSVRDALGEGEVEGHGGKHCVGAGRDDVGDGAVDRGLPGLDRFKHGVAPGVASHRSEWRK